MSVSCTRDLISSNTVSTSVARAAASHGVGVGVLGLEVGDGVGVVAVAQPGPRVVDVAGGALPDVGHLLGDGGPGAGGGGSIGAVSDTVGG